MARRRQLDLETRAQIIALHNTQLSNRAIARQLRISEYCVRQTIKRKVETGHLQDRKRSGRPRATSKAEDRYIKMVSLRNRRLTAPAIAADFNMRHENVISVPTVKRRLAEAGLKGRIAAKKPRLTAIHKRKRLQWARTHQHWTVDQWKKVLWSDESKFEVFGTKRRVFVRRRPGERMKDQNVVQTLKHGGGNIMVWGCFGGGHIGSLIKIDSTMTKEVYLQILKDHGVPTGTQLIGERFVYQQDNDPKHTAKIVKAYFEEQSQAGILTLMEWPAQSPDCNPIELIWDHLGREVHKSLPTNKANLWRVLQNAWNDIDVDYLDKLITRMPRICAAIISARGSYIDEKKLN